MTGEAGGRTPSTLDQNGWRSRRFQTLTVVVTASALVVAGCGTNTSQNASGSDQGETNTSTVSHDFNGLKRVDKTEQGPPPRVRDVAVSWRNQGRMPATVAITAFPATNVAGARAGRRPDKLDFDLLVAAPVGAARGEKVTRNFAPNSVRSGKPITASYQLLLSPAQSNLLRNYARHYRKSSQRVERVFADQLASRYVSVVVRHSRDIKDQGKNDPGHDYLDFGSGRYELPARAAAALSAPERPRVRRGSSAPTGTTSLPEDTTTSSEYQFMLECNQKLGEAPVPTGGGNACGYKMDGISTSGPPLLQRGLALINNSSQPLALTAQPVACVAANGPNSYLKSQQLSPSDEVDAQWIVDGAAVTPPAAPTTSLAGSDPDAFYILNDTVLQPGQGMNIDIQKMRAMVDANGKVTAAGTLADQDANPSADIVQSVSAYWQTLGQINQAKASGADNANIYNGIVQPAVVRQLPATVNYNPNHDRYALNWAQAMPSFWGFLATRAGTQSGQTVEQLQEAYAATHPSADFSTLWEEFGMNLGMLAIMFIPGLGEIAAGPMMAYGVYGLGESIYNVVQAYTASQGTANPNCETGLFQVGATGVGESGYPYQVNQIYEIDVHGNISPHDGEGAYTTNGIALSQYGNNWQNVFNQILANNIHTADDYRAVSESQKQQWAANANDQGADDASLFFSDAVAPAVNAGRDLSNPNTDRSDAYSSSLPAATNTLSQIGWVNDYVTAGEQADPTKAESITCASPIYSWPGPNPAVSANPSALVVDTASNAGGSNLVVGSGVQTGLGSDNKFQTGGNGISVFQPAGGEQDTNPNIRWMNGSNNTPTGDPSNVEYGFNEFYNTQVDGQTAIAMVPAYDGQVNPEHPQNYFFYTGDQAGSNPLPEVYYPYAPDAMPGVDTNVTFNCITGVRYGLLVNPEALIISNLGFGPRTFWMPSPQLTVSYSRRSETNKPSINKTPVALTKTYSAVWLQSGLDTAGTNPLTDSATVQKYSQSESAPLVPGSVITLTLPAPTAAGPWQLRSGGDEIARDNTNPQSPTVMVRVLGEPGTTANVIYSSGTPGQDGSTPPNCDGKVAAALYDCEATLQKAEATFTGIQVPLK